MPSGVPRYELPSEWAMRRLGDITSKIGSGSTPPGGTSTYIDEGTALIRSQNVYDHHFKADGLVFIPEETAHSMRGVTVCEGDILINITGDSILRTTIVPNDMLPARVNQHVAIVRVDESMCPQFVQKWLSSDLMKAYMLNHSSGGTRKAITKGHLESFLIPAPDLETQQRIARVLAALDDKIESNQRQISLASDLVDQLAVYWGSVAEWCSLSKIVVQRKVSVNPAKLDDEEVELLSIPAFDDEQTPELVCASAIKSNKLLVQQESVLVSRLNPRFFRSWFFMPGSVRPALASTEFMVLTAESGRKEDLAPIWLAVRHPAFCDEMLNRVTGTSGSHQRVRPDDLLSIEVPNFSALPVDEKQKVLSLLLCGEQLRRENQTLKSLRDILLPELLSGRITPEQLEVGL
ncbi:restriction endonuclease subunit S [Corynebacterium cystitidis]|uniref:restriction endonuclease subunit S n=1 Tax=Corynebacterium cystitidis TaxID=35757 RepID=UPI00211E9B33|nr:restriction endonuclease subunit S [Corynebacterium cystitidis]